MDALAAGWIEHFSYPAVFLLLLACGVGAPLSEEVIALLGGALVGHGGHSLVLMLLTTYFGEILGDGLLYGIGRKLGERARTIRRFERLLTPERVHWIEDQFKRRGALAVSIVRFIPGVRSPALLMAGMSRMSVRTFALADGLAALVTAPALTLIGYRFGSGLLKELKLGSRWVGIGAVTLLAVMVLISILLSKKTRRPPPAQVPG